MEVRNGAQKERYGAKHGYGNDERDDVRDGRHAAHDGEVNADGPTDGGCRHRVSVNGVFCNS